MEKQKRWQFYLIIAVIALTLYNILPTIFYYTKPLQSPIDAERAQTVATQIVNRVDNLETDSKAWLESFTKLLRVKPESIKLKDNEPGIFEVHFANAKDAEIFKRFLPSAGSLISFVPAQLELAPEAPNTPPETVLVSRLVDVRLDPKNIDKLFQFTSKYDSENNIAPFYRDLVFDRIMQLGLAFGGPSKTALQLEAIAQNPTDSQYNDAVLAIAKEVIEIDSSLGKNSPIAKRYFSNFAQSQTEQPEALLQKYLARAETLKADLTVQKENITKEQQKARDSGQLQDSSKEQRLKTINSDTAVLDNAIAILKKNQDLIKVKNTPFTEKAIQEILSKGFTLMHGKDNIQQLNLDGRNPYIQALNINWDDSLVSLQFYPDVIEIRQSPGSTESSAFLKDKLNQLVIQDISRASQVADEKILPSDSTFAVAIDSLKNTRSVLAFDLGYLAREEVKQIADQIKTTWIPQQGDLSHESYPVLSYDEFQQKSPEEQQLGLVVYAPEMDRGTPPAGFRNGSIYVIARGMDAIMKKYQQAPDNADKKAALASINELNSILNKKGFIGYSGASYGIDPAYRKDYIYELDDYYGTLVKATREEFTVKGNKRYGVLDFTDVEQRILATNRIEDRIQEDLLKWKEAYNVAQVELQPMNKYLIPAPTKNAYWENLKLSLKKYFRGDDRKILHWGLDLSGGKTVRIGLRDHNNRPVTNPDDLRQAVNELYNRVNSMGVSERTIHIENNNIILDFPGSQNLSAADLIKASAMYFHIVNEKFTHTNPELSSAVDRFLQDVWNEAVVTNRKDVQSINMIAWQHLGGDTSTGLTRPPISDAAKELYDSGLRLADPRVQSRSHAFDDTLSSVAVMRGDEFSEWQGQSYPLLIVFNNYALEGSSLNDVQVGYDPSQGNILSFAVKKAYDGARGGSSPRDDFNAWTAQFAQDKIAGTPKEVYTKGNGYRMAVILNDRVISAPALRATLRDGGTISGRFSQREINQLAADLKAGSLTYTPEILSEENVSPELGREERTMGIVAALVALALVVVAMITYYRFAGFVASCAVLFNILIMWGVLQNLGAALTLPGIAGIVLTIAMAVDANVLVFERIREEFKISGRIASAIQAGYRKAFSAIIDSNVTTIIAALILIQFDSGPIKGFAVTLIIGIVSSLFTSLFMTRYFFAGWVQNPKNKELHMMQLIGPTKFDFLAKAKPAIIGSLVIMLLGMYLFVAERKTMFGMDFTGGYSLYAEFIEKPEVDSYRVAALDALLSHGATSNDVQIRELSRPNQLRIQLGTGMEEKGHPFYLMPERFSDAQTTYEFEKNPRILWVVNSLKEAGLEIVPSQLPTLETQWTLISGQLSDSMRNNAIIALTIALISILIYITLRFEFKYAAAAVIALLHDVIITIGLLAFFQWMGLAVQIDLQVIGAIMTIIGYSLNDTIIVFDRIREDLHILRKLSYPEIINHALNVTLSRTLITSGTTLLVLMTLVLLGGHSIFAFSLVMAIGVFVGTFSSLFIATPMLLYFHNREERREIEAQQQRT